MRPRREPPRTAGTGKRVAVGGWQRNYRAPYGFIAPFGVLFLVVYIIPVCYALYNSFEQQHSNALGLGVPQTRFAGASNFVSVLTDAQFWSGMIRLGVFAIVQIPLTTFLALAAALLLDTTLVRFSRFIRFSLFLPYAVPAAVASILWAFLYLPQFSPLTGVIRLIPGAASFSFLNGNTVLWSIANMTVWEFTGFSMLIYMSALRTIPPSMYEAARLDGASEFAIARRIKVPLIIPAIGMTTMFSIVGTLQMFNRPTILRTVTTNISHTYTPNMYTYAAAFYFNNYNQAAAIALVMAVITGLFSFAVLGALSKRNLIQ